MYATRDILEVAHRLALEGRRAALCLVVRARGSTPQSAGSLMLVGDDAELHGTVGGGCVEAEVRRRAHAMLVEGATGLLRFRLDHDYGWDDGLICGGTIEIAVAPSPPAAVLSAALEAAARRAPGTIELEVAEGTGTRRFALDLPPRERLLVAGAGHVGQAVARLASRLEFETTLFDDRADLLERAAPLGVATVAGDIAASLRAATIDAATFVLVVTRGHRHDEQALEAVVGRGARYVGMIGSRRKVRLIFDDLAARGVAEADLATVHAPVGLPIGAVSVEEIAVSIAAQLVQVRRTAAPCSVRELAAPSVAAP